MDNEFFLSMQAIADKRAAAIKKCTGVTCPKCGTEQVQLVSYQPKILLKCRVQGCRERWVVED